MPEITLPTTGETNWSGKLNTAINSVNTSKLDARDARLVGAGSDIRPLNVAYPALYSPTPTVAIAATGATAIAGTPQSIRTQSLQGMSLVGIVPRYNATNVAMTSWCQARGTTGVNVDVRANVIEFHYRASSTGGSYWVWVDDQPVTAAPVAWTGAAASSQRITVTFPGVETHRITLYVDLLELQQIRVAGGHSVEAAPRRPLKFMAIGDSLTDGSGEAIPQLTWVNHMMRLTGWEGVMNAIGGQGYVNGSQPFTHPDRIVAMQDTSIDLYIFKGSVNDNAQSAAAIQAAAELCYQTIYDANPSAKIVVFGPDPTNDTASVAADVRANAEAVRAAALNFSSKNVIGWIDPLMTRSAVPWVGSMVLTAGQRVTFEGAAYLVTQNTSTSGFNSIDFARLSPFYGTGNTTGATANGNRDIYILGTDDVHWSLLAHRYMGHFITDHTLKAIASYGRRVFYSYE